MRKAWLAATAAIAAAVSLWAPTAASAATASASYSSTLWTWGGTWSTSSADRYSGQVGATAKVNFNAVAGATVSLQATKNGANHTQTVSIDGGPATTVNLYASGSTQTTVYTSPALAAGDHTMTVTVTQAYGSVAGATLTNGTFGGAGYTGGSTPPPPPPAGWTQTFFDDFTAPVDGNVWNVYTGGRSGASNSQWGGASHTYSSGGFLNMVASKDAAFGNEWVAAGISHKASQLYGKYEVRARIPNATGVAFAFGLWPVRNVWPPEIDFTEDNGANPRTEVYGTLHYGPNGVDNQVGVQAAVDLTQWHTWGVEWSPGKLVFTVDGNAWGTINNSNVTAEAMSLFMQVEPWQQGISPASTWEHTVTSSTPPTTLQVDWVREYKAS